MFSQCCNNNPRTNERCHIHKNQMLTLFCSNRQCLQPLCVQCLQNHQNIHLNNRNGKPKIVEMKNLQDHSQKTIDRELKLIQQCRDKDHKPEQSIYKLIDKFLYGTMQKRQILLKQQKKQIQKQFDAHLLVRMIEEGHTYKIDQDFQIKYFSFLDKLIDNVSKRHEEKEERYYR